MSKNPNPQGKGLVTVFDALEQSRALTPVKPKHIDQISNELFYSLFVLHSHFQFKPVVGKSYWLYGREGQFRLSLISPLEWSDQTFGQFIGECELQKDMTWTLKLDKAIENDIEFTSFIELKRSQFEQALIYANSIDETLPYYIDGLPFYQRLYAAALACSLRDSMFKSHIQGLNYEQAKQLTTA